MTAVGRRNDYLHHVGQTVSLLVMVSPRGVSVGRHCLQHEFQCNNSLCKPLRWMCDGEDDCGDNSDENPEECGEIYRISNLRQSSPIKSFVPLMLHSSGSLGKFQCPPTRQFRCHNDRVCLPLSKRCDGVDDCGDQSDELYCRKFQKQKAKSVVLFNNKF